MFLSLETLTSIIRTGLSILVTLNDLVNFPTRIPDYDSHSPALLDFFFQTLVFVLQWLSLHLEILIMLLSQFPLTFHQIHKGMPRFIACDYSFADWDGLPDPLRDVPWDDNFKLGSSAAASEFCK